MLTKNNTMKTVLDNIEKYKYIPTYLLENQCFACGKDNPEGLKMKFYTDGEKIFSQVYLHENKRGWEQIVHGGILSTILDEIMAWSAIYFTERFILTKSINISYKNAVTINSKIKAIGWIEEIKNNKEAILKSQIYNEKNILCAEASGVFALFSNKLAKKLKLMSAETIDQFEVFIKTCKKEESC